MSDDVAQRTATADRNKEAWGWLSLIVLMALFPLLFFICVFFPIWLGVASS